MGFKPISGYTPQYGDNQNCTFYFLMTLLCPELQENYSKNVILLVSQNGALVGH